MNSAVDTKLSNTDIYCKKFDSRLFLALDALSAPLVHFFPNSVDLEHRTGLKIIYSWNFNCGLLTRMYIEIHNSDWSWIVSNQVGATGDGTVSNCKCPND